MAHTHSLAMTHTYTHEKLKRKFFAFSKNQRIFYEDWPENQRKPLLRKLAFCDFVWVYCILFETKKITCFFFFKFSFIFFFLTLREIDHKFSAEFKKGLEREIKDIGFLLSRLSKREKKDMKSRTRTFDFFRYHTLTPTESATIGL